jgi:autotransporter-associated beta strand protein
MRPFAALFTISLHLSGSCLAQVVNSSWVYPSASGNLLYQLDERGQRIIDFSHCGYRSGVEPLPNVNAVIPQSRWVYVSPGTGDDTTLIQTAIDSVEAMTPDANGWRGVVFLNAGEYQLASTITINASGVVLKGAGDDPTTGTRLRATDARQYNLISVTVSGSRSTVAGTTHDLTQKLVPAGARTFEVDSTAGLAVGHTVIVKRPSTANWIADIDMDQLGPGSFGGQADDVPWAPGAYDLLFDRTVTRIDGNWITVDVPLPQTFEQLYGGGQIWRYTWANRLQQVGIEDIYGFSDYASTTDELHAWTFIRITNMQNGWVKNITAQYFGYAAVSIGDGAKWLTVADSQCLDPISLIDGGRRYSFNNDGAECSLFVNCYARKGRHDFVFGATVPGPNAFVHGTADTAYSDTGPHHRWSVGGLFDLVTVNGHDLNVQNRGNSGTGHGWAGAYMTVWNCKANTFRVRNPPTSRNWLIGSIGNIGASSGAVGADPPGTYDSSGPSGTGKPVHTRSLYHGQLQQRLKWPGSEFREVWLGDLDQHSSAGGTGEAMNCDPAWLAQLEALDALPASANFDQLSGSRHVAFTLDFPRTPGDTVVAASLTVSLRAIGSAATDGIRLENTTSPQTFASLGWNPISTTTPTVRTLEVSPSMLSDGRLNVALGTNCAVDYAVLHLQVQKAQPSVSNVTLLAVADAHVQGGTNAVNNFGTATSLATKEDSNVDLDREAFVRWDLSGITGKIVQAKVRLMTTSTSQAGNENAASFVSDDTWSETAVTFSNKPASDKLFAQWIPITNQAVEFSVTPQVLDAQLGDRLLSLRIAATDNHGAAGNVSYASRENAITANRPQLILTIENPPTAAVKAASGSILSTDTAWTNGFVPANPDTATWNATSLAGSLTFDTDLNWSGLILGSPSNPLTFSSRQFLLLGSAGIDMSTSTVDLTLNHPVHLSASQTWNVASGRSITVSGAVSGSAALTKTGSGIVTLSGPCTYSGSTTLDQGTLAFTGTQSLPGSLNFGSVATNTTSAILDLTSSTTTFGGTLLVNTNTTTANEIKIGPTQSLTINNNVQIGVTAPAIASTSNLTFTGGGTFNVITPAAGTFLVGAANGTTSRQDATLDLTALKAASINTSPTGTLRIGPSTNNFNGRGTLLLPIPAVADTIATTTLTAATLAVGNGSSGGGTMHNITLGTGLTRINADTINVGTGSRDVGQIIYGQSAGDLIIRAADGTSRAAAINVASLNGVTANTQTSSVELNGHDADILVTSLNVGNQARTNALNVAFNFGEGDGSLASKLDVTNVSIGIRPQTTNTANVTHTARVNLSGGTVIFGNATSTGSGVDIGNNAFFGNGSTNGSTVGELNISGGTVTLHNSTSLGAAVRLGTNTPTGNATVSATMNLSGGMTTLGGDIIRNVTSPRSTSTVKLSGGSLNMSGNKIGTATEPVAFTVESGTLSNIGSVNGVGGLTKTTSGTLTLSGTNTYTGPTTLSSGTLALSGSLAGALTANGGILAPRGLPSTGGSLTLTTSSTFQPRINGNTAGTQYDQITASGSVTLAGPLDLLPAVVLTAGSSFTILNKTSAGAISGTFTGKPEGSVFNEDGYTWIISYVGGNGNDVVLTLATHLQSWRFTNFGTLSNTGTAADSANPDGDAWTNADEYIFGTNPTSPQNGSLLSTTSSGSNVTLSFNANAATGPGYNGRNRLYDVECTSDFVNWITLTDFANIVGANQTVIVTQPLSGGRKFYRLKVRLQ